MFKFGSKDINLDYSIMSKNNIPLLIEDKTWIKLFGDNQDKDIVKFKTELEDYAIDLKKAYKEKQLAVNGKRDLMAQIINLSHRVNNGDEINSLPQLQEKQEELLKLNEVLEEAQFKVEIIPSQMRKANYNLLKTTVKLAYQNLKEDERHFESLVEDIEHYREKLRIMIEQKNDYEEKINETYKFMHSMLGGKEIDKLDKNMLE
ncbi:hypothetical protein [Abyssisolibacter fermentans]|uniref:hypothetical protein n=1 Tax=Abyssisolibacter fermentans TaxID=1766203 RepID=UPI00082CDCF0|nr:hypothetical protein [Abyssisolibacter fermentans]